ncbi:MAG TPA: hypothetical protein V6D20_15240, partial [Candidatus Obscuribacterales bacterium]
DSEWLATSSHDGSVNFWTLDDGYTDAGQVERSRFRTSKYPIDLAWNSSGTQLAVLFDHISTPAHKTHQLCILKTGI